MKSSFLRLALHIFGIYIILTDGCGPAKYELISGECCSVCPIGTVVLSDCTANSNTTCTPCSSGTFMSEPNALHKCFQCKICDKEQGLFVLQNCTTTNNAVCEILDGYHCKEYSGSECTFALKHTQCNPGQKIKVPGTKTSDVVCETCPPGFHSPLGINCTKQADCSDEIEDKEGSSTDIQCKPKTRGRYGLIPTTFILLGF
ncbi:hypothetical protein NFI96_011517 [Prochilodus magdalenae]|nr:hypothetical protein NFI96_011517 [Prochilodus magdalenae]